MLMNVFANALEQNTNLFEFYILNSNEPVMGMSDNIQVFNTSLTKETFYRTMQQIHCKHQKTQVQQYKCTVLGELQYMNFENKDIVICSKRTASVYQVSNNILFIGSNKKKLSILSFPSTQTFDNEEYVRVMTFKISNRLSVQFSQSKPINCENTTYKVKIAYTHDSNVDRDTVIKQLNNLLRDLQQASTC